MRPGPSACIRHARTSKLGLGLAAFAAEMGVLRGPGARQTAGETLHAAARAGVEMFHGPEGFESLVQAVGEARFLLHLDSAGLGPDQIEGRMAMARERLARTQAPGLMLDGARLLQNDGDRLWRAALLLRDAGDCTALGVTVEAGGDALGLARRFKPEVMQLACGLLDQRLVADGALGEIAALGIEIHLRTPLLQGLLFLPREGLPPAMAEAGPLVSRVRRTIAEAGADPLQAALAFALDRPEASGVVVEAGSVGEVRALLAAAAAPSPQLDWPALALDHPAALDAEAQLRRKAA